MADLWVNVLKDLEPLLLTPAARCMLALTCKALLDRFGPPRNYLRKLAREGVLKGMVDDWKPFQRVSAQLKLSRLAELFHLSVIDGRIAVDPGLMSPMTPTCPDCAGYMTVLAGFSGQLCRVPRCHLKRVPACHYPECNAVMCEHHGLSCRSDAFPPVFMQCCYCLQATQYCRRHGQHDSLEMYHRPAHIQPCPGPCNGHKAVCRNCVADKIFPVCIDCLPTNDRQLIALQAHFRRTTPSCIIL